MWEEVGLRHLLLRLAWHLHERALPAQHNRLHDGRAVSGRHALPCQLDGASLHGGGWLAGFGQLLRRDVQRPDIAERRVPELNLS